MQYDPLILKKIKRYKIKIIRITFTEQNRTEMLFVKTCTYIHHHTQHLIQLYTRDIQF